MATVTTVPSTIVTATDVGGSVKAGPVEGRRNIALSTRT